jgi:sugar O-acyltransferase (sialic acid O-acetyltransferase NeuD family)
LPVLGKIADAPKFKSAQFVNGIGSPRSYRRKPDIIRAAGIAADRWATVIHPSAAVSRHAQVGHGVVLLAGVSVGARVRLGDHVLVLQNSVVSHDTVVGSYTAVATSVSISGQCVIGENCYLGSNASLRESVRIGDRALVGMAAVVTKDVAADTTVIGNPARPYRA